MYVEAAGEASRVIAEPPKLVGDGSGSPEPGPTPAPARAPEG